MKRVLSLVVAVVLTFSVLNVTWVYAIEPYEMQPNYIGVATRYTAMFFETVREAQKGSEEAKLELVELKKSLQGEFF